MRCIVIVATLAVTGLALGCMTPKVPGAETATRGTVTFSASASSVVAKQGDPLAMLEAREAAETMALANLLKKIKGAYVTSEVTVGDLMFSSQEATTRVDGFLARADVELVPSEPDKTVVTARATLTIPRSHLKSLDEYAE